MKTLIAYFSHRGMNYAPGGMVELKVGNTERAAKAAAELTGAPLFEIRAERDYPFDYHECVEVSKRELKENARPALAELPEGLGELETLVLCYPCWCGTMPMPVWSFLEALGPGAPRILPLCTNEGSGMGRLVAEQCDFKVSIPMKGKLNSLNASAAAAILLYEAVRQRLG